MTTDPTTPTADPSPPRTPLRNESWAGWIRRDTSGDSEATSRVKENRMVQKASSRARMIVASSVELYREMALSAISLVRR